MATLLEEYADDLSRRTGLTIRGGEVLAKILSPNDDSGRHGVLIPSEAYSFFPPLRIPNPAQNETLLFDGFDALENSPRELAWKYYQRYPERRVTRVNGIVNDRTKGRRVIVFVRARQHDGRDVFVVDAAREKRDAAFRDLVAALFGKGVPQGPGAWVRMPIGTKFAPDASLKKLLNQFDRVADFGWIPTHRPGDTGVGKTFEDICGIEENNDKRADFEGIEVKCKLVKGEDDASGKTNLFQQSPEWAMSMPALERIALLGSKGEGGLYQLYSAVTVSPNNLGLALSVRRETARIALLKRALSVGHWAFATLQTRLEEKHSRAVFIKALSRGKGPKIEYRYFDLVYCEKPSIANFLELVETKDIVFEFTMSEKDKNGVRSVRNHGYPWRLVSQGQLSQLFELQVKLRGAKSGG